MSAFFVQYRNKLPHVGPVDQASQDLVKHPRLPGPVGKEKMKKGRGKSLMTRVKEKKVVTDE